ncbi:MAG: CoB--CoM heterodisulfide reductase iron-sulfur subunit B family protein [Deltaproteobacteria bacterium]
MKIGYYPGCSLESTAREYDLSFRAVAAKVGIELIEIPDWNCCGASAAHAVDPFLALALPARNLMIAEALELDITAPCAACFLRLMEAKKRMGEDVSLRQEIEDVLGRQYRGSTNVYHPLTVFSQPEVKKEIRRAVVNKLKGLRVVCYYGCYLVRPPATTHLDDPENPILMDELIGMTGAEVLDWSWKVDCCGGGHALLRPELVEPLVNEIVEGAHKAGAQGIVTACPLCQSNLETRQKGPSALPIFYFTELLGLAMGLNKEAEGWWKRHLITPKFIVTLQT